METKAILKIGFANQYFTLWKVYVSYSKDLIGRYIATKNTEFIQNLSKDKATAISKAVEMGCTITDVDNDLIGYAKSFRQFIKNFCEIPPHLTAFVLDGDMRYFGNKLISMVTDENFHIMYAEKYQNRYSIAWLKENDYNVEITTRYCPYIDSDVQDVVVRKIVVVNDYNVEPEIISDVIIQTTSNLSYKGTDSDFEHFFLTSNDDTIKFVFEDVKEMFYNGIAYFLPINSKGKSVRIKNKSVRIIKAEMVKNPIEKYIDDKLTYIVKEFEVVK